MKLLSQYNRVTLICTVLIMFFTALAYYQAISWVLIRQSDKDLKDAEMQLFEYINTYNELPKTFESKYQQITFTKVPSNSVKRRFIDTAYFKKWGKDNLKRRKYNRDGENEAGRGLITSVNVGGNYYKVIIVQSKAETEDLIRIIFSITICVILALLFILFVVNRFVLNRIWKPFYTIMGELRLFNISDNKEMPKLHTSIDEFNELNTTVIEMTAKAKSDYKTLKSFTENASHELLTPIAVISSKLDILVQTDHFTEKQDKLLNDLYTGISKLNKLNQSLLLLVKIENQLLFEQQSIDMRLLIGELVDQFKDIFYDKELHFVCELNDKTITASRYLIEILLGNLIGNAVRHNHQGGTINITLTPQQLIISNTGNHDALDVSKIFNRFYKSEGSEGTGLGLTICKQICENLGYQLHYRFSSPQHQFVIDFD